MKTALNPRPKSDTLCGNRFAPLQTAPKSTGAIQPSGNKTCRFLFATPNVVEKHTNNTHENKTMKSLTERPKVSTSFNTGYAAWKKNWEAFTIAGLLLFWGQTFCCVLSLFVMPPLFCGAMIVALGAVRGEKVGGGDTFLGFRKFLPAFVSQLVFLLLYLAVIGLLIAAFEDSPILFVFIVLATPFYIQIAFLSLLAIADQNAGVGQAIVYPFTQFGQKGFWSFMCLLFAVLIVWTIGFAVGCLGAIVTIPVSLAMLAAGYCEALPKESAEAAA